MESRLVAIPALIEKLYSDPAVSARIKGREADFLVAAREALVNAVVHGNRSDVSRKVFIRCICEADGALSIVIRDEGSGFDPNRIPERKNMSEDLGRGIQLIVSSMDEVGFRKNGTEICMRIARRQKSPN